MYEEIEIATFIVIPKVIHYCWFGHRPLPKLAKKCISSWGKFFPDYEIKEWNEDNFDVNVIPYTSEAYKEKKYAFVSDYARFWILYHYGGVYFDTDVEVIRPFDDLIEKGPFMGRENECVLTTNNKSIGVNPGLGFASPPGHTLLKELLDLYETLHFVNKSGIINYKTIVEHTTECLLHYGLTHKNEIQFVAGFYVYPKEYFCPKDYVYLGKGQLTITQNSRSIHHFAESWHSDSKVKKTIAKILPSCVLAKIWKIKKKFNLS